MRISAACLFLLSAACTSEPLEFADWTIPVPEGTPIVGYASVPLEERADRIELARDLVIGGDAEDPEYAFYRANDLEVSEDGRIFVHDDGNHRIQVFDADGTYLRSIGREGSGPGELNGTGQLAVAGGRLIRIGDSRLDVWTLEGEHLSSRQVTFARSLLRPSGQTAGSVVTSYREPSEDETKQFRIVRLSSDAEMIHEYASLATSADVITLITDMGPVIVELPGSSPAFAALPDGTVYFTLGDEYQVLALQASGEPKWALRTAWPRAPLTQQDKEAAILRRVVDTSVDQLGIDWPEFNSTLSRDSLNVDGHGSLYVFPRVPHGWEREEYPVDVYSRDGDLIFAGLIPMRDWLAALGDFIYTIERDPVTEEQLVVRYRLVEPF